MGRHSPVHSARARSALPRLLGWTAFGLACLVAWDLSGLDLPLATWMGTPYGFPLRFNTTLSLVAHSGMRTLGWLIALALFVGIRWPWGVLRGLARRERVQLAFTVLFSALAISLLKHFSHTSCPWDLQAFGGTAQLVSHWRWTVSDGGGGHCFPAGHASVAFAYVGGYFAFCRTNPKVALRWLALAAVAGLLLGVVQQLRGAHFMSHTLWTAWICWVVAFVIDAVIHRSYTQAVMVAPAGR